MVSENGLAQQGEDFQDEEEHAQFEWLQQQLAAHMEGGHDDWTDPTGGKLTKLLEAAEDNAFEQAKALVEEGGFDFNLPGPDGDTPLHVASLYGSCQIAQVRAVLKGGKGLACCCSST